MFCRSHLFLEADSFEDFVIENVQRMESTASYQSSNFSVVDSVGRVAMSGFVDNSLPVHRVAHQFSIVGEKTQVYVDIPVPSGLRDGISKRFENWQRLVLNKLVDVTNDKTVLDVPLNEGGEKELLAGLHATDETASGSAHEPVVDSELEHVRGEIVSGQLGVFKGW